MKVVACSVFDHCTPCGENMPTTPSRFEWLTTSFQRAIWNQPNCYESGLANGPGKLRRTDFNPSLRIGLYQTLGAMDTVLMLP